MWVYDFIVGGKSVMARIGIFELVGSDSHKYTRQDEAYIQVGAWHESSENFTRRKMEKL